MSIKSTVITAMLLAGAVALPAQASDYECKSGPKSEWKSLEFVKQALVGQGYEIRKVEVEDGCYEVYAKKDGKKLEVFVNPATGAIEKIKEK